MSLNVILGGLIWINKDQRCNYQTEREGIKEPELLFISKHCLFFCDDSVFCFFLPAAHVAGAGPEPASEVIYDDVPCEDPLSPAEGEWLRHKDARPLIRSCWCVMLLSCVTRYDL